MNDMANFWWFTIAAILAGTIVGINAGLGWGLSVYVVLCAIKNAVIAGYIEGRIRFEQAELNKTVDRSLAMK